MRILNGSRELVGIYLEPAADAPPQHHAVLLCNPFGQEAIRAHRLYRVMADRLAAAGYPVLRFDYYGSGDSAGDDADWDLHGSISDAQAALAELLRRSRALRWSAMGLRLGGAIALETARRAAQPAQVLLLIEPVLDGRTYLDSLAASSLVALNRGYGVRWPLSARLRHTMLPAPQAEALGFAISPACRAQIESVAPSCLLPVPANRLNLLVPHADATLQTLAQADVHLPACATVANSDAKIDWATDSAAATAIVPMHWIRHLTEALALPAHA
ncbi:MAG: alpha/beta hydrolase [Thiomonas sp.]|nr:alpha/beta hydrolase [Thiomonas sp.]